MADGFVAKTLLTQMLQCIARGGGLSSRPGGTAAAAPLPFRPGKPALCGSRPL